jgi:hypothetical protein
VFRILTILLALALTAGCTGNTSQLTDTAESAGGPVAEESIDCIAFGSCAFQWDEQPIWQAVVATEPDVLVTLKAVGADGTTAFEHRIHSDQERNQ